MEWCPLCVDVCLAVNHVETTASRLGRFFARRRSLCHNQPLVYSRFHSSLRFKMASLINTSLHSLLNGFIFVSHYIRNTVLQIQNLMTYFGKLIKFGIELQYAYLPISSR